MYTKKPSLFVLAILAASSASSFADDMYVTFWLTYTDPDVYVCVTQYGRAPPDDAVTSMRER